MARRFPSMMMAFCMIDIIKFGGYMFMYIILPNSTMVATEIAVIVLGLQRCQSFLIKMR